MTWTMIQKGKGKSKYTHTVPLYTVPQGAQAWITQLKYYLQSTLYLPVLPLPQNSSPDDATND